MRAAEPSPSKFFFDATGATADDVARAIADTYGVSVLLTDSLAGQKVSGRLEAANLEDSLEALAFFTGSTFRQDSSKKAYFFGGKEPKSFVQFPSYGLTSAELATALKGEVSLLGDRVFIEAEPAKVTQIKEALQGLAVRPTLTLEVFLLDVSTNMTDRVNAWLDTFRVGGGFSSSSVAAAALNPVGTVVNGFTRDVEIKALWQLLDKDNSAKVEYRQQAQILSGTETRFSSGQVVERPLIVREPQTGRDLVTSIERRTIGLQLSLRATAFPDGWQVSFDLSDSQLAQNQERTTTFIGQRRIRDTEGFFLLTSFVRTTTEKANREVPGFSKIPMAGKFFRKSIADVANRSVMLLARPILVQREASKVGGP